MKIGIVGGGIGGLSAAICLVKAGIEVEVFERAPAIREIGAGVSLWPNATRVLAQMGLLRECLAKSTPLSSLELRTFKKKILLETRIDQEETPVICMHRPELLEILHSEVSEKSLFPNHHCKTITPLGSQVALEFDGQETRIFDAVIGADGARSQVRSYVTGLRQEPVYRGYQIWRGVADFELGVNSSKIIQETWGNGRRFGILPITQSRLCWYATETTDKTREGAGENRKADIRSLFKGWPSPITEIIEATPPQEIFRNNAADLAVRGPWYRGHVTLIGDAAHPLTPNLGQGCCLALEDAFVLSQSLQNTGNIENAFEGFWRARRKRVTTIMRTTRWIGSLGQTRSESAAFVRDRLLKRLFPLVYVSAVQPIHRFDATANS